METVHLSWTPTNWLTVFLMAVGGFVIIKGLVMVATMVAQRSGQ